MPAERCRPPHSRANRRRPADAHRRTGTRPTRAGRSRRRSEAADASLPLRAECKQHIAGRLAELTVARADEQHAGAREYRLAVDAAALAFDPVQRSEVAQRVVLPDDVAARGIVDEDATVECTCHD